MLKKITLFLVFFNTFCVFGQNDSTANFVDSLSEVSVSAFGLNKNWKEVPASVGRITTRQIEYVGTNNLLPAVNTLPGVRMEERSPNSYRLSIRGSLLRSPFGVRNIKVYWNGLPLTDGGGNTYFNLIDATQLSAIEIIKGPAASVYGANTGGVVLPKSSNPFTDKSQNHCQFAVNGGSSGLLQQQASWQYQNTSFSSKLIQSHQQSDGYRQQSASRKDNITWLASYKYKQHQFDIISFILSNTRGHYIGTNAAKPNTRKASN